MDRNGPGMGTDKTGKRLLRRERQAADHNVGRTVSLGVCLQSLEWLDQRLLPPPMEDVCGLAEEREDPRDRAMGGTMDRDAAAVVRSAAGAGSDHAGESPC